MIRAALLTVFFLVSAGVAQADDPDSNVETDYVETTGRLTDEAFYRVVGCGAPPDGECSFPFVRWPAERARDLRVRLENPPVGYPDDLSRDLHLALDRVIDEINSVQADLTLRRTRGKESEDILVSMLNTSGGELVRGSGVRDLEGSEMGAAFVYVWWDDLNRITDSRIFMADDLPADEVVPVLLEEMTQALGFLSDIRNPLYDAVSVFSEDSNTVTTLGRQDRAVLLRHYPPLR